MYESILLENGGITVMVVGVSDSRINNISEQVFHEQDVEIGIKITVPPVTRSVRNAFCRWLFLMDSPLTFSLWLLYKSRSRIGSATIASKVTEQVLQW